MRSKFLSLNTRDFIRGMIVAVLSSVVTFLATLLPVGIPIDSTLWMKLAIAAVSGLFSYLILKLSTNSKGEIGVEPKQQP